MGNRSIHDINKRDIVELVSAIDQRGASIAANKALKDRVLTDAELARVISAARTMEGPYGHIVEFLALTGQRREEVARATWDEFDLSEQTWTLPKTRAKNGKAHIVHLSDQAAAVLGRSQKTGTHVFTLDGTKPFQRFSAAKRKLDELSGVADWRLHDLRRTCVSGMARLGIAPHVADKVLNHQSGTISGVAAVYQRHDFLIERKEAMERWGKHVAQIIETDSRVAGGGAAIGDAPATAFRERSIPRMRGPERRLPSWQSSIRSLPESPVRVALRLP